MRPLRAPRARSPWAAGNSVASAPKPLQKGRFSRAAAGRPASLAASVLALLVVACGGNPEAVPEALPYDDPGFAEAGDWRLHYALTMTGDLASGIAGSYGIVPRPNLALLTIVMTPRDPAGDKRIDTPEIEAAAVALTGERRSLLLTRHEAPAGASFLATMEVRHRVPATIEIRARATPASPEIRVRLTREFRFE